MKALTLGGDVLRAACGAVRALAGKHSGPPIDRPVNGRSSHFYAIPAVTVLDVAAARFVARWLTHILSLASRSARVCPARELQA